MYIWLVENMEIPHAENMTKQKATEEDLLNVATSSLTIKTEFLIKIDITYCF